MAITIEEMAASYVQTVQAELQRAVETMQQNEQILQQNREYIVQVEAHLKECTDLIANGQAQSIVGSDPQVVPAENPVTTVESELPDNPFVST
jgi:ATP/maltotriose-dependent transcriptional regulator MalT